MNAGMNSRLLVLISAILAAAVLRLVPHPPNLTPIGAMALFGGAMFGRRAVAFLAPLAALLLSDLIIGFHDGMVWVYGSVALIVMVGMGALARVSALRVLGAALASSALFFVITNFGVWATSGMYAKSVGGLAACYVAAIPFFQNTIAGDLFYSALLFGGFALLERAVPALREQARPVAA